MGEVGVEPTMFLMSQIYSLLASSFCILAQECLGGNLIPPKGKSVHCDRTTHQSFSTNRCNEQVRIELTLHLAGT